MPTVEHEIVLPAPSEQVWNQIIKLDDLALWLDGVTAVRSISTAQTQAGTRFEIVRAGQHAVEHWIVLDWQPQQSLRLTEYHQDRHLRLALETLATGTRLRAQLEWKAARGLLQRLRPPTAQHRSLERSLLRLRALIDENRSSS